MAVLTNQNGPKIFFGFIIFTFTNTVRGKKYIKILKNKNHRKSIRTFEPASPKPARNRLIEPPLVDNDPKYQLH